PYTLRLFIAGDVNNDGDVNGDDAALLAQAMGTSAGQPGYLVGADANLDGVIDATDTGLLAVDLGFVANRPPVIAATPLKTHTDLTLTTDASALISDPEDDPVYVRVAGAQHGTATLGLDGHTVIFVPDPGYSGPAGIELQGDDGYSTSPVVTVPVNVSAAPLVQLDFMTRNLRLNPGDTRALLVIGDFADQQGVFLPPSYVTLASQ